MKLQATYRRADDVDAEVERRHFEGSDYEQLLEQAREATPAEAVMIHVMVDRD